MSSTSRQRDDRNRLKKKMSKEQLHLALTKKKECDARALAIVERLIDTEVDQTWLLKNLEHVNQCHMEDVIEERAILKRCGYALCDNELKFNINQKYHISTRSNKVYDVSRRKNFCSNNCYGAGNYILEQMLTSPLWLRDPKDKPQYQLLPLARLSRKSTPGDEIDLGIENIVIDANKVMKKPGTQNSDEPLPPEDHVTENLTTDESQDSGNKEERVPATDRTEITLRPDKEAISDSKADDEKDKTLVIEREKKFERSNPPPVIPVESKRRRSRSKIESKQEKFDPVWLVERIERYLMEWITLDSLVLLLGDPGLKQQKISETTEGLESAEMKQKKYIQLCKKVNLLQLDEDSEDEESKANLKPLPDYGVLKEEGKKLEVKVRAFFEGRTVMETPSTDASTQETNDSSTFLPALSEREPKILRRRIVLEKLDKVLPEMLRTLAGGEFVVQGCISSEGCGKTVKALVNTLSLSAGNVIPKPAEWNLLGLVFIKLLSITEPRLRFLLATERATKYITMILMSYNLEPNYLDRMVATTTDVESYLRRDSLKDSSALK